MIERNELVEGTSEELQDTHQSSAEILEFKQKLRKHKIALHFGYCGDAYHGSAAMCNKLFPTVEDTLFQSLCKARLFSLENQNGDWQNKNSWKRASRTDKGVHALQNVISLKVQLPTESNIESIPTFLAPHLPPDIRVFSSIPVTNSFNSYEDCTSRTYCYILPTYALLGKHRKKDFSKRIIALCSTADHEAIDSPSENIETEVCIKKNIVDKPKGEGQTEVQKSSTSSCSRNAEAHMYIKRILRLQPKHFDHIEELFNMPIEEIIDQERESSEFRALLSKAQRLLGVFLGTNSFHNFTPKKASDDPSCMRYISESTISRVSLGEGKSHECLLVRISGQSFMLNQIRKMVSAVLCIINEDLNEEYLSTLLRKDFAHDIPMLPANGLFLRSLSFDRYNSKLERIKLEGNNCDKMVIHFDGETDESKLFEDEIVKRILQKETSERVLARWLSYTSLRYN